MSEAYRQTADSIWPIAKLVVVDTDNGLSTRIASATFYTPGLPPGEHDVYPIGVDSEAVPLCEAGPNKPDGSRIPPIAPTVVEPVAAKLRRSIACWEASVPHAMAFQSVAVLTFAFDDARHDILALNAASQAPAIPVGQDMLRTALQNMLDHAASQGWWLAPHATQVMDDARAALSTSKEG